ncbi:related to adenosine deaminase [Serendipita indica DSM 11827]|uniref:adenosine deaminase n=1 Tax=Serendipita indica (strain DSM 11827) TaxID=1109443 RepID=G4TD67_SERID|nr:related to adenosine deaminase [Serendipita indica DSM 11827]
MSSIVDSYLAKRKELIEEDTSLRADRAKLRNLTPLEAKAEALVRQIRKHEAEEVFSFTLFLHEVPDVASNQIWSQKNESLEHPFPGMAFLTAKKTIESTRIFKIIKKMPKGALLHAHLEATVDARVLLDLALEHPNICIRSPCAIDASNMGNILPDFAPLPLAQLKELEASPSITSSYYNPGTYIPIHKARNEWPASLGNGFDDWVIRAIVINPTEAYGTHNTTVKIWDKFVSCFSVIRGLVAYEPVYRKYIRALFESCIEDGVSYAEIRMNFTPKTIVAADGAGAVDHSYFVGIFQDVVQEFKADLTAQGKGNLFHGAKLIYTVIRILSVEELKWYLDDCLELKKKFPDTLAAFDLVGPEDKMNPLIYYLEPLLEFSRTCEEQGVDLPFLFHAGETLGDGDSVDQNLYDAILLGTKRIGHAFSLVKHPALMRLCRERNICCEVCPVSNEILRLTSSMPAHPLAAMLNHGVPVALASDDPGIFSNIGISYDFFQVLVASEISGLMTLGVLARQSIEHALLGAESKAELLKVWDCQWTEYIEEILAEHTK